MSKIRLIVTTASGVIAATATLLNALRENPQLSESIDGAVGKLRSSMNSENPKLRFEAKLNAIDVAATAVEETFPYATEPSGWRRQAQALRMRGELAWSANTGKARRKGMKALNAETAEVLSQVNERLAELQTTPAEVTGS
ncbi:hypothetical protein [Tessaracoccus massiliensis]|uniref:hypothetical protein n=1 Tax=Tessaracoccus massiliensis TaxID=1522311 RepID=UPI0005914432|nr:hypothetical protein [Tessaracoccus massiliensis]